MFGYFYEEPTSNRSYKRYTKGSERHFCERIGREGIFRMYTRLAYRSTYLCRAELNMPRAGARRHQLFYNSMSFNARNKTRDANLKTDTIVRGNGNNNQRSMPRSRYIASTSEVTGIADNVIFVDGCREGKCQRRYWRIKFARSGARERLRWNSISSYYIDNAVIMRNFFLDTIFLDETTNARSPETSIPQFSENIERLTNKFEQHYCVFIL